MALKSYGDFSFDSSLVSCYTCVTRKEVAVLREIAIEIQSCGGTAFIVGGAVRDSIMGVESKDIDVEVFGISLDNLHEILLRQEKSTVSTVGKSFGILKFSAECGLEVDFSVPRRDNRIGVGHKGFSTEFDPDMTIEEAAMRRDFTMNALSINILTNELIDPCNGVCDIKSNTLRVIDPDKFIEDPLRVLRAMQFIARFGLSFDDDLCQLCSTVDLSQLPAERIFEEFKKMFLKGQSVFSAFEFLRKSNAIRFFPELENLIGVEQEPEWHPEGDVWIHTLMVVAEAFEISRLELESEHDKLTLMFSALLHDVGKPATTEVIDGRIRSRGHEAAGEEPARMFMERLKAPKALTDAVIALVVDHLAPHHMVSGGAKRGAFRRLARRLCMCGTDVNMLFRLGKADHFGRLTNDAVLRQYPQGELFIQEARKAMNDLEVESGPQDVVMGRHLIARGLTPGPNFGIILNQCREVQDDQGIDNPEEILDIVLQ